MRNNHKSKIINPKSAETPKQYIQGWTEFYKLKFKLTPDVLIPRPESELLVDEVIRLAGSDPGQTRLTQPSKKGPTLSVADVGTGSGNLAVSIAKNLKKARVLATDISEKALEIAKQNAKFHKMEKRILFLQSDMLENIQKAPDIIVANLPYIPTGRILYLDPMVTEFEPRVALDGGKDGFELYRKLFDQMKEKNIIPKYLVAEIDYTHADIATFEATKRFPNCSVDIKLDLAKKQRILLVKF